MNLPHIISSGVYREVERAHQIIPAPWISFGISGLARETVYDPDGNFYSGFDASETPFRPRLIAGVPGFKVDFEYDESRENWVVIFDGALHYDPRDRQHYLDYDGRHLPIPRCVLLEPGEIEPMRCVFRRITEYFFSTIPRNLLTAEMMTASLLQRFLQVPQAEDDAVESLRKRIDADCRWEKSIAAHCGELGCGRDRLRQLFEARYKIAPGEYRIRKRLQEIMRLFAYSTLSLKEIADAVGMKNATHLNQLIRERYGKTPSALCREFRRHSS